MKKILGASQIQVKRFLSPPFIVFFICALSLGFLIHRVTMYLITPCDYTSNLQKKKENREYLLNVVLNDSRWRHDECGAVVSFTGDGKVFYEGPGDYIIFFSFIETTDGFYDETDYLFSKELDDEPVSDDISNAINETKKNCSELEKKLECNTIYLAEGRFVFDPKCYTDIGVIWDKIEKKSNPEEQTLTLPDFGRVTSMMRYTGTFPHDSIFPPFHELSWSEYTLYEIKDKNRKK